MGLSPEFMSALTALAPVFCYLRRMGRRALDAFEEREDGVWVCTRAVLIAGPGGSIRVEKGQTFPPRTVFAGHNDFTAYLASVSVADPPPTTRGR